MYTQKNICKLEAFIRFGGLPPSIWASTGAEGETDQTETIAGFRVGPRLRLPSTWARLQRSPVLFPRVNVKPDESTNTVAMFPCIIQHKHT